MPEGKKMFMTEITDKLEHYVYRLLDPRNGETFYVGMGSDNRVFEHVNENHPSDDPLSCKHIRIREIENCGFKVQHIIHRHGMDRSTALEVEAALIEAYPGLTNLMSGHGSSERGAAHVDEIVARYSAKEAELTDKIIEITINASRLERSVYFATQAAWVVNLSNAQKVDYALAVNRGVVVEVFSIREWLPATKSNFPGVLVEDVPGRFGFEGDIAPPHIRQKYLGCRMPQRARGAANPVRYFNV